MSVQNVVPLFRRFVFGGAEQGQLTFSEDPIATRESQAQGTFGDS